MILARRFISKALDMKLREACLFLVMKFFSAVITWYAAKKLVIERKSSPILREPVVFAILHHHHAMGIEERFRASKQRLRDISTAVKDLKEDIEELRVFIPKILLDKLLEVLEKIEKEDSRTFVNDVYEKFKSGVGEELWNIFARTRSNTNSLNVSILKKMSLLMLSCLTSLDYIAASKIRGQDRETVFGEVMKDFYEIYCKPPRYRLQ